MDDILHMTPAPKTSYVHRKPHNYLNSWKYSVRKHEVSTTGINAPMAAKYAK